MGSSISRRQVVLRILCVLISLPIVWLFWRTYLYGEEEVVIARLQAEGAEVSTDEVRLAFLGIPLRDRESSVSFGNGKLNLRLASRLRSPFSLLLSDVALSEDDASQFARMESLTILTMIRVCPDENAWHGLESLRNLEWLWLEQTPIGDGGMACLSGLRNLTKLHLVECRVTDESLRYLAALANLYELRLGGSAITGRGLRYLKNLPNLRVVDLPSCNLTDGGLEVLRDLPSLSSVNLADTPISDKAMEHVSHMPNLHILDLSRTRITDAGLGTLERMGSLDRLVLDHTIVSERAVVKLQAAIPGLIIVRDPTRSRKGG